MQTTIDKKINHRNSFMKALEFAKKRGHISKAKYESLKREYDEHNNTKKK